MPQITRIQEQIRRTGRVNIYVDGKFAFGISEKLLVDLDLFKGKELTPEDQKSIAEAENLSKCLDKAYRFLSYRPRSEKEMRDKLLEKFEEETTDKAIEKLKEYRYVDDAQFARSWVADRKSGRGQKALAFELKRKGVAKEIIEAALADLDKDEEFESALKLVQSKSKYRGLTGNEAYQKIGGFLSRRGFGYDVIKRVIKEVK